MFLPRNFRLDFCLFIDDAKICLKMTDCLDVNCDAHELMVPKFGPEKVVCH